jgi:hypothetical protein
MYNAYGFDVRMTVSKAIRTVYNWCANNINSRNKSVCYYWIIVHYRIGSYSSN